MGITVEELTTKLRNLEFDTALRNCRRILDLWTVTYMDCDNPSIKSEFKATETSNELEIKFTISMKGANEDV